MQRNSVNKVILVGHVGQDPEPRYTPAGTAVVNLSVATNEVRRDSEGNDQESTEWHRVVLFGKRAEFAGNYIKKGRLVYVEGRLQTRKWEDKNKVERWSTEVMVDNITMLGGRTDSDGGAPPEEAPSVSEAPPDDDDIPF